MPEQPENTSAGAHSKLSLASAKCAIIGSILLIGACAGGHVSRSLERTLSEQQDSLGDLHRAMTESKEVPIRWKDAHERMMRDNLSLRQSREQLEQAKRATSEQWLSLAPRLAAFMNVGESLTELTNLNSDSISAQLIANLNIPNPFDFYAGLYGAALRQQSAEWSHELDRRRAYIQLHGLFNEQQLLLRAVQAHERRVNELRTVQVTELSSRIATLNSEAEFLRRRTSMHRAQINNILNTPGANWSLAGNAPKIPALSSNRNPRVGEDFGRLALKLQAVQVEVAQLRIKQSQFRQWPTISFGLATPPLLTTSDSGSSFSADNMLFFTGANQSFNITDPANHRPVRDARRRLEFTREQLLLRAESEALQLQRARAMYETLSRENDRLTRQAGRTSRMRTSAPEVVLREIEQHTEVETRRQEIRRQLHQMDLQYLIWYDDFWKDN